MNAASYTGSGQAPVQPPAPPTGGNPAGRAGPPIEIGAAAGPPLFWTPSFFEALRWAWKPLLIFFLFTLTGSLALGITVFAYDPSLEAVGVLGLCLGGGVLGVLVGQFLALLRIRLLVFTVLTYFAVQILALTAVFAVLTAGSIGAYIALFVFCFGFGLPSGMMSLHHRLELLAAFWPAIGWIGSVFVILNHDGRVEQWEENKLSAWMPVPLGLLFGFIVFLLLFLVSKQTMRIELWQALSGSPARRVVERAQLTAVPKRNLLWVGAAAVVLFGVTAVLSPYLFRTTKGDRDGKNQQESDRKDGKGDGKDGKDGKGDGKDGKSDGKDGKGDGKGQGKDGKGDGKDGKGDGKGQGKQQQGKGDGSKGQEEQPKQNPFDEDALQRILEQMAGAAKKAVWALLPLLLLAIFFRPIRRAFLTSYLKIPLLPTTPSERIVYLWEYVRISVEDTGLDVPASDAVEETIDRVRKDGLDTTDLQVAADIYMRARYDMVLRPQDPIVMRAASIRAAKALRKTIPFGRKITNWWRSLA